MKKLLFLLCFISSFVSAQINLSDTSIIGQKSRNQKVGNGLQISDTLIVDGVQINNSLGGFGTGIVGISNTGLLSWIATPIGGSPAGNNNEIQFNANGSFGASPSFVWDSVLNQFRLVGKFGSNPLLLFTSPAGDTTVLMQPRGAMYLKNTGTSRAALTVTQTVSQPTAVFNGGTGVQINVIPDGSSSDSVLTEVNGVIQKVAQNSIGSYSPFDTSITVNAIIQKDTTKYVGIGTTIPQSALDINGNINLNDTLKWNGIPEFVVTSGGGANVESYFVGQTTNKVFGTTGGSFFGANTVFGVSAGENLQYVSSFLDASNNSFYGVQAGQAFTSGTGNTAIGDAAINQIRTGSANVGIGQFSGGGSDTSSDENVFIGNNSALYGLFGLGIHFHNQIYIGYDADSISKGIFGNGNSGRLAYMGNDLAYANKDNSAQIGYIGVATDTQGHYTWQPSTYQGTGDSIVTVSRLSSIGSGVLYDSSNTWNTHGNTGTTTDNFLGTTDAQSLIFKSNNVSFGILDAVNSNVAFGPDALNTTTGAALVGIGNSALQSSSGNFITAIGNAAANGNTGSNVVSIGSTCALNNIGSHIVSSGEGACESNSGNDVIASGISAALSNTGSRVIAIGHDAAAGNVGSDVISFGINSCENNTKDDVTGIGLNSSEENEGSHVIGIGANACHSNLADKVIGLGSGASEDNTANNVISIGTNAGKGNSVPNSLFINLSNSNGDSVTSIIYANQDNLKVKINGKLQVNDGTPGVGKVFTDINGTGLGSWQPPALFDTTQCLNSIHAESIVACSPLNINAQSVNISSDTLRLNGKYPMMNYDSIQGAGFTPVWRDAQKLSISSAAATYATSASLSTLAAKQSSDSGVIMTAVNSKGVGTVTTFTVTTANGFSGTVANPTTTPAITLTLNSITSSTTATTQSAGDNSTKVATTAYVATALGSYAKIVASVDSTGQTASDANLTTYANPSLGTYEIGGYFTITALTVGTVTLNCVYTGEDNASRTVVMGTSSVSGAVNIPTSQIRVKGGTNIVMNTVVTGTATVDCGASIVFLR